jgi:hypothetical protein
MSEQEKFYKRINQTADDHSTEIKLGLAYGRYRFWKAVWTSKPAQFVLLAILVAICWVFGNDNGGQIILCTIITIFVWMMLSFAIAVIGGL